MTRSFDLFDTLLGRLHYRPSSIFDRIEKNFPYPGFVFLRMAAEYKSDRTLPDIYRQFQRLAEITDEQTSALMQFELNTELSQVFPIEENLSLVQDGDLIVSDTYYDKKQIEMILNKIGLKRNVHIYASPDGKRSGQIWDLIRNERQVDCHLGDSLHSDVHMAESRAIKALHYSNSQLSSAEQTLMKMGQGELACLMRALRLQNPYPPSSPEYLLWNEQAQLNIPILIAASLYLNDFCQKHRKRRVLFTSRDGCLWIQIFRILFPQYDSVYFHASRYTYINPTPSYIAYVKSMYSNDAAIVDSHGKGESCELFFNKHFQTQPVYLAIVNSGKKHHAILRKAELCTSIELLNYDACGALYDVQDNEAKRSDPEYDLRFVRPMHQCVEKCKELLPQYSIEAFDIRVMEWAFEAMNRGLVVAQYINHAKHHWHFLHDNEVEHMHYYN